MTYEELDRARSDEATAPEISPADWACADWADPIGFGLNDERHGRAYAAMMARTGWTPPVAVDPDLLLARKIEAGRLGVPPTVSNAILRGAHDGDIEIERTVETIKRGRELERAEAKSKGSKTAAFQAGSAGYRDWQDLTHYAVITPPEAVA